MRFKSDGCTFWLDGNWVKCCLKHDTAYAHGGTRKQRKFADKQLKICVSKKGHPIMANLMYFAVRIFGSPFFPSCWRWGFLNEKRGYTK